MHEDPVSTGPQNPGARLAKEAAARGIRAAWKRVWHSLYETLIEPRSADEDSRRKELIFNIIALFLLAVLVFLELSVIYADIAGAAKVGFHAGTFMFFVFIFGSLLAMSRKGNTELASYIFIGLYFLATTYGAYAWSTAMPVALLSYGAIIVITSVLIGTRAGLAMTAIIAATLTSLGFLETNHVVESDLSWRLGPLEIKDTIEDALIYVVIVVASWLSNREIERSLKRARTSEKALKSERDLLEIKVEERTKELKAAELEKVSQLYRFVEFGRLASGIFYDLLNPLSVVSLSVEKLTADEPNAAASQMEARRHIERAVNASKRMEAFLQTARKQLDSQDRKQLFSTNREVADAVGLLTHKSLKACVVIRIKSAGDIEIIGNPVKFFQVAVNLISNAIDAYHDTAPSVEKPVIASIASADGYVRFSVEDRGVGIREDLKQAIFQPFFTTKRDRSIHEAGFGLGLSTTKEIVERDFGGTIEVESVLGKGSRFTVIIPTAPAHARTARTDLPVDRAGP